MSLLYLDTSALVKRYFPEIASPWVEALTDPNAKHTIILSALTRVETAAAAAAKHRASDGITITERDAAVRLLARHCTQQYIMIATSDSILDRAMLLTQAHRLRGYDAVQLATALIVNEQYLAAHLPALTFIAVDKDLLAAAQAERLTIDTPHNHSDFSVTNSRETQEGT